MLSVPALISTQEPVNLHKIWYENFVRIPQFPHLLLLRSP